jgi:serine protease Do
VRVKCNDKNVALGTVVGADGWILTKFSQLDGPAVCMLKDGRQLAARLTGVWEPFDLAMLKIETRDLTSVRWANVKDAVVGNWVATPGLAAEPVAVGVVSVAARKVTSRDQPPVAKNSGFLGIAMDAAENGGVRISGVVPDSPAAKAGLRVNDLILGVGDKVIKDPDTLVGTIQRYKAGKTVTLKVQRDDEDMKIKATLDKRPSGDRSDFQNSLGNELSDRRGGFPAILQHDTQLRPVDCGGPLVDLDGKAVGINIARAGRTETYAVPADAITPTLLAELKSGKLLPAEDAETASKN